MSEDIEVETVEATVVEDSPDVQTTALVRRERRSEVLRPLDADQLSASFREYQALLPKLLEGSDYQDAGQGRRFVKKSGWRKIATAFDLDVILVTNDVDRDENGHALRAKVVARAIAPSGRTMDGDGYCSIDEKRFNGSRADRSKLENDLRATATTRAKNRAIADLVGMGDVSAEEMSDPVPAAVPQPFGPVMTQEVAAATGAAVVKICGGDKEAGTVLWQKIRARLGGLMPQAAALALIDAADALTAVPWDPEYTEAEVKPVDRDAGSKPVEVVDGEPADETTDLEAAAYDAWRRAGTSEREAVTRVKNANGDPKALQILIDAAERIVAKKDKVTA